jgi:hypothetical protein
MAGEGDARGCKNLLERDLRFWRMVLAESSSIVNKLIAASALEQHFMMGNLVLRRFPAGRAASVIPDGWREPISSRERSMEKVMANEWEFADKTIGRAAQIGKRASEDGESDIEASTAKVVGKFLLQPQATSNSNAERMIAIAALFDRDYDEMPAAADSLLASRKFAQKSLTELGVYNPAGEILVSMGNLSAFSAYGFRVANLEGVRRAALLTAQLRFNGVKAENVAESLQKSELRDPYDGGPFTWSDAGQSVVFRLALAEKPDLNLVY